MREYYYKGWILSTIVEHYSNSQFGKNNRLPIACRNQHPEKRSEDLKFFQSTGSCKLQLIVNAELRITACSSAVFGDLKKKNDFFRRLRCP